MSKEGPSSPKRERPIFSEKFSPVSHRALTRTPKPEFLLQIAQIKAFNQALGEQIHNTFLQIYSYVYDRVPSDIELTFFVNTAGTAIYEAKNNEKINGKDHGLKAGNVYCLIRNTLLAINNALQEAVEAEEKLLEDFRAALTVQHNVYVQALKQLSATNKQHLQQHANLMVDQLNIITVTPNTKKRAQDAYPATSPGRTHPHQVTPKKLRKNDLLGRFVMEGAIHNQSGLASADAALSLSGKPEHLLTPSDLLRAQSRQIQTAVATTATQTQNAAKPSVALGFVPRSVMLARRNAAPVKLPAPLPEVSDIFAPPTQAELLHKDPGLYFGLPPLKKPGSTAQTRLPVMVQLDSDEGDAEELDKTTGTGLYKGLKK